ncbi:MAG: GNAT family N-acetyltransferase [Desulfobacter sp.]|nr:MAG: GNAT family N-acetyltransferase [Desulfobacter sp.]
MVPTLKTKRLTLRPLAFSDRDALVDAIMSDKDVMKWLPRSDEASTPEGLGKAEAGYLEDFIPPWDELGYGVWAVCIGEPGLGTLGDFIGYCGFIPEQIKGAGPEIAYALRKSMWGRGLATEALGACLDWIFTRPEIRRVHAVTDTGNRASRHVMKKAGMSHQEDVDLYDSVAKGDGLLPLYSLDRAGYRRGTGQCSGLLIREAQEPDCINLAALSLEVWFTTYSFDGIRTENSEYALSMFTEDRFKSILADGGYRLLVCTQGIYLRGYVLLNLDSRSQGEAKGFEIDKLYVQKPFQGRGIGKALLLEVKARYGERFWLTSWVYNRSIGFYKRFGFRDIGRHNFKLGEDTIENRVLAYG